MYKMTMFTEERDVDFRAHFGLGHPFGEIRVRRHKHIFDNTVKIEINSRPPVAEWVEVHEFAQTLAAVSVAVGLMEIGADPLYAFKRAGFTEPEAT